MTDKNIKITIAKLAIEYWRVIRSYERNLSSMSNSTSAASVIRNSELKFNNILSDNDLRFLNYEGYAYSPNLPLTVINADEFEGNEDLVVLQMIEPTIVDDQGIINLGKALLSRRSG